MHFCEVAARVYGRLSKPRNTSLNWFIPALVNSSVGSSPGTTGLDGTTVWPFDSKNFRNDWRMSEAFIRRFYVSVADAEWHSPCPFHPDAPHGPRPAVHRRRHARGAEVARARPDGAGPCQHLPLQP